MEETQPPRNHTSSENAMLEQAVSDSSFIEEATPIEATGVPDGSTEDYHGSDEGSGRALPPRSSGNVENEENLPVATEVDRTAETRDSRDGGARSAHTSGCPSS